MKPKEIDHETWLDLSAAAEFLGVHFTTLRRWADAGDIACIRTPGGRRRFSVKTLEQFIAGLAQEPGASLVQPPASGLAAIQPMQERAIQHTQQSIHNLPAHANWFSGMSEAQRLHLKGTGHHLMALLLQYNNINRTDGGEAFLEEGKRFMREYASVCLQVQLTLPETVRVFLFFRSSILDSIQETGSLGGSEDHEGLRLYHRTTEFLDQLLLDLIGSYLQYQNQISA